MGASLERNGTITHILFTSKPSLSISTETITFGFAWLSILNNRLFNQVFNPFYNNNWRVLLLTKSGIVEHIIKQVSVVIYEMQTNIEISEAVVLKKYFSDIETLRIRENYSVEVAKSIYPRLPYPTNKGGFEKDFIEFCDSDSEVDSIIKIKENYHDFAYLNYIRTDGQIAAYFPDFIIKVDGKIYMIETKAQNDLDNRNVINKEKSALDWIKKINELPESDIMNCKWNYVIIGDNTFYAMKDNGASVKDILEYSKLTSIKTEGNWLSLMEDE